MKKFIKDNYKCKQFTMSDKPNKDGKFIVDGRDIRVINGDIVSLTNNLFIWGEVKGYFNCSHCKSLTSLEGAPGKVGGDFGCSDCDSLKSLNYLPKYISRNLYIRNISVKNLTRKYIEFLTRVRGDIYLGI